MSESSKEIEFPWVEEVGFDEIGARILTHYSPDEGAQRFIEAHSPGFFWKNIEDNLLKCREIMAEHGEDAESYSFPSNHNAKPYTDIWYAREVGLLCSLVLQHRGTYIPEVAMARIMEIGSRCKEWEWRRNYKSHIVRGDKTLKASRSGAKARRDVLAPDTTARLEKMAELLRDRPEMTPTWAAKVAFKRGFGKSAAANAMLWIRHHGKKP